ncbi:MAG: peptidyl-prolyl cis-trans isomerase [Paracoccaceae bacterium]
MAKEGNSISRTAVWILMGLLILGLGGFGVDGILNGSQSRVARVGDKDVDVQTYFRALQSAMSSESQARGETVSMDQARAIGLDAAVLSRLVTERALDHEASELGISIGNENLRDQIVSIPAFQGVDGSFDRDGYRFALENSGLSEAAFENRLREETSRTILQGAVLTGVTMPDTYSQTLVNYVAETRDFSWARLDETDLGDTLADPTEGELRSFYDENIDDFGLPETKRITFAVLRPEQILDTIIVPTEDLEKEYQARSAEYKQPERRLVERLAFLDEAAANAAAAQLEVEGTTFEALVQERGLALADVDMGDVGRLELDAAGEAVFGANVGDVVGPLQTGLGPALFRVNGILPAQNTSFEDAEPRLRTDLAIDRARRLIASQAEDLEDILAGGATIEDLASGSDMEVGQIDWHSAVGEGIAAYSEFRSAAARLQADDFPSIMPLDDGAIFAMRLDETLPPRPAPYEDSTESIRANWEADRAETLLMVKANALLPDLQSGKTFSGVSLDSVEEENIDRSGFIAGTPPAFMSEVFSMNVGDVKAIESFGSVLVVQLNAINPASENEQAQQLKDQLSAQMDQALARNLYTIFAQDAMLRAGQEIDVNALEAVHANFH